MANRLPKSILNCKSKVERDFELSKETLFSVGWIGALGHAAYWFIWTYLLPQPYESVYLRFFCAALYAALLFHKHIPATLERWMPLYWFVTVTLGLPAIFTFLMLMNDFGSVYMTCEVMVIFLLAIFLRGIVSVTASLLSGALLGCFLYLCFAPTGHSLGNFGVLIEFSPLLGFALLSGVVFTQELREGVRIQEMRIAAQEQEQNLRALAGCAFNRKIAIAHLQTMGIEAEEAENGRAAVARLSQDDSIDVLLIDMEMPVMDGMQAARELRGGETGGRRLPIIALTGNFGDDYVAQVLEAGMDDFISKPFSVEDLRAKLVKVLTRQDAHSTDSSEQTGAATTTDTGVPLIHAEQLDRMCKLNNKLLMECLTAYIEQMRERFDRLEEQMAKGNFTGFRTQLHKLLGDAGEAGFYALHQFLKNEVYPTVAYHQQWPESEGWLTTSKDLYAQTVHAMRKTYLANAPT